MDMEPWDRGTVEGEIAAFQANGSLDGLTEQEVRQRFGEPDDVMPGLSSQSPDGQVLFEAEKDLRYFGLLPHTCVNISFVAGRVGHVGYWAKWRTCPSDRRDSLGKQYAPS
jgi:hypothetical protein